MAIQFTVSAKGPKWTASPTLATRFKSLRGASVTLNDVGPYKVVDVDDVGLKLASPRGVPANVSWSAIESLLID